MSDTEIERRKAEKEKVKAASSTSAGPAASVGAIRKKKTLKQVLAEKEKLKSDAVSSLLQKIKPC